MSTVAKLAPAASFNAGSRAFSLHGLGSRLVGWYRQMKAEDRVRAHLVKLTPHLLRDIGLSDGEIRDLQQTHNKFDPNDIDRRRLG